MRIGMNIGPSGLRPVIGGSGIGISGLSPMMRGSLRLPGMGFRSRRGLFLQFTGMHFFDRSIIRRNWAAINDTPLTKAGNMVRHIARQSIRHVGFLTPTGRKSKPGKQRGDGTWGPPKSRSPGKPFKLIFSVPDFRRGKVVIGMVGWRNRNASAPAPAIHEHGLTVTVKRRGRSRTARYPKRAFMVPALMRTRAILPGLWRNSLI